MNSELESKSRGDTGQQGSHEHGKGNQVFLYKDSGILERHGKVPFWLVLVLIALVIWSIYYLIAYWTPPA